VKELKDEEEGAIPTIKDSLWNPVKELKGASCVSSCLSFSISWNPVKELKGPSRTESPVRFRHRWNPVKELKVCSKPCQQFGVLFIMWNPVKELKELQVTSSQHVIKCPWNPVKELKDYVPGIAVSSLPVWNPVKELKATIVQRDFSSRFVTMWNPVKELKVTGTATWRERMRLICGIR